MNSGYAAAPSSSVASYQQKSFETYKEETFDSNGYYSQNQQVLQAEEYVENSVDTNGYQSANQHQYQQGLPEEYNNGYNGQGNHQGLEYVDQANHENTEQNGKEVSLKAIALYDYQANDSDEISFDPNDIIVDIVQVSE